MTSLGYSAKCFESFKRCIQASFDVIKCNENYMGMLRLKKQSESKRKSYFISWQFFPPGLRSLSELKSWQGASFQSEDSALVLSIRIWMLKL